MGPTFEVAKKLQSSCDQSDEDKVFDDTTKRHDTTHLRRTMNHAQTTAKTPDTGMKVVPASLHQGQRNPKQV